MDKSTLEKAIYEAINKIRKIDRRRPYSENIVKVAAAKHGLNQDVVRKHLAFLVESGAVYIELTANEEESYFIYDLEKFTDGDSKNCGDPANGCSSSSDSLSLGFGDTRHDNSSPIEPDNGAQMSEFFRFLDIADRLTDDIRRLHDALAIERDKNEKLLIENCELKIENNKLKLQTPGTTQLLYGQAKIEDNAVNNKNIVFESIAIESDTASQKSIPAENNKVSQKKKRPNKRQRRNNKTHIGNTDNKQKENNQGNATKELPSRKESEEEVAEAQVASAYEDFISQKGRASGKTSEESSTRKEGPQDRRKKVIIIGDSMVKNIHSWKLRAALRQNVIVRSISGAKTSDMVHYTKPVVEENANLHILHCGTNDLRSKMTAETIAQNITKVALSMKKDNSSIIVSGICPRGDNDDLNEKACLVNEKLREICNSRNIGFINNDNIDKAQHLNKSRLHLNRYGDAILTGNLREAIEKC